MRVVFDSLRDDVNDAFLALQRKRAGVAPCDAVNITGGA